MGIDPVTHKPKNDPLLSPAAAAAADGGAASTHCAKAAATLSHMAQWETARLEAEARLARQSKLRSSNLNNKPPPPPSLDSHPPLLPRCLDVLNAWQGPVTGGAGGELESPTSTVSYSENAAAAVQAVAGVGGEASTAADMIDFVGSSGGSSTAEEGGGVVKEEGGEDEWKVAISYGSPEINDVAVTVEGPWTPESLKTVNDVHVAEENFVEGFTSLLLSNTGEEEEEEEGQSSPENAVAGGGGDDDDYYEDNKNYWNSILNLVNSSPSESPIF